MEDARLPITPDRLRAFDQAWNEHDAGAVISLMTDDCTHHASARPKLLGTSFLGHAAMRSAAEAFFAANPGAEFVDDIAVAAGNRWFTGWTLRTRGSNSKIVEVRGCDLLEFRNGLIAVKDGFYKSR